MQNRKRVRNNMVHIPKKRSIRERKVTILKPNNKGLPGTAKDVFVFIRKTINNIFLTACKNFNRHVIATYSMGYTAYKGSIRMSPTALEVSGQKFASLLIERGHPKIKLVLRTPGFFIGSITRGFGMTPLKITKVIPRYRYGHNGMRKKKLRRV